MGTFWSYFLEFFGLVSLLRGAGANAAVSSTPALTSDNRSELTR